MTVERAALHGVAVGTLLAVPLLALADIAAQFGALEELSGVLLVVLILTTSLISSMLEVPRGH